MGRSDATLEATGAAPAGRGYRFAAAVVPDLVACVDVVLILLAALVPYLLYVPYYPGLVENYVFCALFVAAATVIMMARSGLYKPAAIMNPIGKSDLVIVSVVSAFFFFLTIAFSLKVSALYSRVWIYLFAASSVGALLAGRFVVQGMLRRLSARRVIGRNLVVLADGAEGARFLATYANKAPQLTEIVGVFVPSSVSEASPRPREIAGHPVLGDEAALLEFARRHRVDDIVVAMPLGPGGALQETVEALKELPVNVFVASQFLDYALRFNPTLGFPRELPLFEVVSRPISGWSALLKTLEDYILSALLVILLSPLLIVVAIAIKIDSPGPIFFKQRRLGFNNKEFEIYKFRSMYHRSVPEVRVEQARQGDPRVTRVGRIIRRTSIDELPQLFNVLNGTMSLVGPRPHALSHNEDYGQRIRGYFARHKVKPGITGWAQVNNLRGETQTLEKMTARVEYDIFYAENWSLLFDLRILITTVVVVLFQKTAY